MAKRMLIDALHSEETRVVIADENQIFDFDFVSIAKKQLKGNIYLAKITRVEPSLQAAFVEYGGGKQGFLPFSEIHADYYQIPISDRKRLMEEAQSDEPSEESESELHRPEFSTGETYGQQPVIEPVANESSPTLTDDITAASVAAADEPLTSARTQPDNIENNHPAYLMQGAIDIAVSEEVEPTEQDQTPISQALTETTEETTILTEQTDINTPPSAEPPTGENASGEAPTNEGVETLPNEEEEYRNRPKKNLFFKRYKIQEVIRRGQVVLVQVIKEERGNKGVSLTTYLSLAGRYCVLMPNSPKDGGISRKIASADDRKRLKSISSELKLATGMSVIIRTAGMDRTRAEIKRDYDYLVKLWNHIREDTLKSNAPALIYEESDIIKRAIRDQYSSDIDELIIEGDNGYKAAKEFMKLLLPSHTPKIKHYKEATPLFYAYNIEEQLLSMHDPIVKLRSGGYIVINPTEALISIDVNSGRATGERNIEETAAKTNLEAANEVARQLRLRDLAGLIVIDFIDMLESRNRRAIEKALKEALKADRAKIQLGRISPFGLLEMSRQRLRPSISETNMVQCSHCVGRGFIRSNESMSIQMVRAIEKEASAGIWSGLRLIAPQSVALHLLNHKRDILRGIEQRYNLTIQVLIGPDLTSSEFNLEKMRRSQSERNESNDVRRHRRPERAPEAAPAEAENDNMESSADNPDTAKDSSFTGDGARRNRGRRNRRGGRNRNEQNERVETTATTEDFLSAETDPNVSNAETSPSNEDKEPAGRYPRNRGGRGRRRWRDKDGRGRKENNGTYNNGASTNENNVFSDESDGNTLPAFATEDRIAAQVAVAERIHEPVPPVVVPESTPRNPDAPVKKGWWQKIIELDD